jgi:Cof subfamily protein (haloacid dehalogenase superfamily)
MTLKLVAIDLDDTLLDSTLSISGPCKSNIRAAREKGVIITLATGRMYSSALPFALQLEVDVPLITYQGALVKNSQTQQVLYYQPLAPDMAVAVMKYFQKAGVHYHSYFDDQLCLESRSEEGMNYAQLAGVEPLIVPSLVDACRQGQEALKIMAVNRDQERLLEMEKDLKHIYGSSLHITRSKPYYLEIMNPRANKALALKTLAEHFGIQQREVMALGDSYNDMEMIKWAGLGVAMGNAPAEVKRVADFVTASNDEDGVAQALQYWILGKEQSKNEY